MSHARSHVRLLLGRRWLSNSSKPDFYALLGVSRNATPKQIRAAFLERAKALHPDAQNTAAAQDGSAATGRAGSGAGGAAASSGAAARDGATRGATAEGSFVVLLEAYRTLSDRRARQLYDLSVAAGGPEVLRRAAAAGLHGASPGAQDEEDVDLSWGLGRMLNKDVGAAAPGAIDRLRAELRSELHGALRRAYLGPPIDPGLGPALPDWFEADERSPAVDTADVLQLVSGRTLLGVVRERTAGALGGGRLTSALPAPCDVAVQGHEPVAAAAAPSRSAAGDAADAAGAEPASQKHAHSTAGCHDLLDLWIGEDLIATASRPRLSLAAPGRPSGGAVCPESAVSVFIDGTRVATLEPPSSPSASYQPTQSRILDADGVHTHTVLRSSTLLVRHLSFLSEPDHSESRRRSGAPLCVCRARRAWLPPSSLWLFRPRAYTHDIGGYYIEWAGQRSARHAAWLHPAVFLLAAAFDTLDHERARRQPAGLFAWVRQAGRPGPGSAAAWLRSMLRFHRRPDS